MRNASPIPHLLKAGGWCLARGQSSPPHRRTWVVQFLAQPTNVPLSPQNKHKQQNTKQQWQKKKQLENWRTNHIAMDMSSLIFCFCFSDGILLCYPGRSWTSGSLASALDMSSFVHYRHQHHHHHHNSHLISFAKKKMTVWPLIKAGRSTLSSDHTCFILHPRKQWENGWEDHCFLHALQVRSAISACPPNAGPNSFSSSTPGFRSPDNLNVY